MDAIGQRTSSVEVVEIVPGVCRIGCGFVQVTLDIGRGHSNGLFHPYKRGCYWKMSHAVAD